MSRPTVFIVDDDAAVRDSLALLCETADLHAECYGSARAFLDAIHAERPGCLVLDVRMPEMEGPELQRELTRRGMRLPIVFLTAHGDIPMAVRAMKAGAADFLTKPVDGATLMARVQAALARQSQEIVRAAEMRRQHERVTSLTRREREVMTLAVAGHPNKEIARLLGISHRTVEIHRSRILRKTGAASLLELARLAESSGASETSPGPTS